MNQWNYEPSLFLILNSILIALLSKKRYALASTVAKENIIFNIVHSCDNLDFLYAHVCITLRLNNNLTLHQILFNCPINQFYKFTTMIIII